MNSFLPMLAQQSAAEPAASGWFAMSDESKTQMLYVGIFSALILSLLVWAAFVRKAKKKRRRITRPHHWQAGPGAEKSERHRTRRERRRRSSGASSNLPANPTLASKGGLPPRRPEDVPPNGT